MPHATQDVKVVPFPRDGSTLDMGAEIHGADLNNLDGMSTIQLADGEVLTELQIPASISYVMRFTKTCS